MNTRFNAGWIKVWRKIEDCKALQDEQFDKYHAFTWLIMNANVRTSVTAKGDKVKRGQLATSYRELANAWNWSVKKTYDFLQNLQETHMVTLEGTRKGTLVTIEKYGTYQDSRNTNGNANGNKKGKPSKKNKEEIEKKAVNGTDLGSVPNGKMDKEKLYALELQEMGPAEKWV